MKLTAIASMTVLAFSASTGFAQDSGAAHPSFAIADSNKDGKLSVAELSAVLPTVNIKDADHDGFVNQEEAQVSISGLALEDFDADGEIGEDEYEAIVAYASKPGADGAGAGDTVLDPAAGDRTPRTGAPGRTGTED